MTRCRAFSLVEVLIGTCVLLFILFPAFTLMGQSHRVMACSRMNTEAAARLQTLVEDFRAMRFSDIQTHYATGSQPRDLSALMNSKGFSGTRYFASASFSQPAGQSGLLRADFTLSWTDAFGRIQSRVYHTRFSQNGLSDQILQGF